MLCLKKYKADVKCCYGDEEKEMTIEFWAADESDAQNKLSMLCETNRKLDYRLNNIGPRFSNIEEIEE